MSKEATMRNTLLLSFVLFVGSCHAAVDMTVTDKATGSDVVEAVIELIRQSCIFDDDRLLLRRIAYAETQDGTAQITFEHDEVAFYGGIWQVSEVEFTATKNSSTTTVYGQIQKTFNVEWSTVQYTDLVKPLYSGLAARLMIDAYYKSSNTEIPQSVQEQASYWAQNYTINTWESLNVTIDIYVSASANVTKSCSSPKADIVFVLDGSGSIGQANFAYVKQFVVDIVGSFDVSQEQVRIGLIEFSNTAKAEFDLTTYNSTSAVQTAVKGIPYYTGGTNSAAALESLRVMIQKEGRQGEGVAVMSIFMTDGKSNSAAATAATANSLHEKMPEVTVFAIGVGSNVDVSELDVIASTPSCLHVYQLTSFDYVTAFTDQIMYQACKVPAQVELNDTVNGVLNYNQYYYFKIKVHKLNKGVKVQVKTSSGGVKTYFSWKVHNPSPALYDYVSDADDKMTDGATLSIPWNDDAATSSRRKRDTSTDAIATLYGAIAGVQQTANQFHLSLSNPQVTTTDAPSSATSLLSGVVLFGLLTLIAVALQ